MKSKEQLIPVLFFGIENSLDAERYMELDLNCNKGYSN
jgi:hypothetical protein